MDCFVPRNDELHSDDIGHLPLHQQALARRGTSKPWPGGAPASLGPAGRQQALAWGTSKRVTLVQRGDNYMPFKSITLKKK
jgi:peptide/nickel transport system substrate-binding protein